MRKIACVLSSLIICAVPQNAQAARKQQQAHRTPPVMSIQVRPRELALCESFAQLRGRSVSWWQAGADTASQQALLAVIIALCLIDSANSENGAMTAIRLRQANQTVASGSF
jgi:hypothetical protein